MTDRRRYAGIILLGAIFFIFFLISANGCFFSTGAKDDIVAEPGKVMGNAIEKANAAACKANLQQMKMGIQTYYAQFGNYPKSLNELTPNLIPSVPKEPNDGQYNYNPSNGEVTCSLGHSLNN